VSDYETIQRRRNIAVGIFVITAICAAVGLIFKFGDLPIKVREIRSFQVTVQFPTAAGVQKNTTVYFCGYPVGSVTKVKPPQVLKDLRTGQFYHQTIVVLSINKEYDNIPEEAEVKLMSRGLGSSYIELKTKPFDITQTDRKFLGTGSKMQGSTGMTSEFFPEESQKKFEELAESFSSLVKNTNEIIGDPNNKENLNRILTNMSKATSRATQALEAFQELSVSGTTTLKNADVRMKELITAMVGTSEELSKTAAQLRIVLEKINEGGGSLGRLVNDGRFYENMLENSQQLQVLLEEMTSFIADVNESGLRSKW
jgi:phospholipid/cholesterol/gamma-HCH transport system substrate-binding protein